MTLPRYTPRVLMIVHDPWVAPGVRLHQQMGWHDPDVLALQYQADIRLASHGAVAYEICERVDAPWFPVKVDGFCYDSDSYVRRLRAARMHQPDGLDYRQRLQQFELITRFNRGDFDEVWVFSFPYAGEYESIMIGPTAIWCNAPALRIADLRANMVMMGFNVERDVGCMLENFGHRMESMLAYWSRRDSRVAQLWQDFCGYDQQGTGPAGCGNVHFAPNSRRDYDWGHRQAVWSHCDWWRTYPYGGNRSLRQVDCSEWGNGDMRAHHIWWLQHLPHHPDWVEGVWGDWWKHAFEVGQFDEA